MKSVEKRRDGCGGRGEERRGQKGRGDEVRWGRRRPGVEIAESGC